MLFSAKNTSFEGLQRAGVVVGGKGKVRLRRRDELDPDWNPATDRRITDWESAQHLTRSLTAEWGGGVAEAARLVLGMGAERADKARALAYRLYSLAERKRWTDEAHAYNILVTSWPQIRTEAARLAAGVPEQAGLRSPRRSGAMTATAHPTSFSTAQTPTGMVPCTAHCNNRGPLTPDAGARALRSLDRTRLGR